MKKTVSALILAVLLFLCSCSVQTEFDIKNYCDRFNSLAGYEMISAESFFSDGEGKLFAFIETGNSKMLVSVDVDEKAGIKSMGLSLFKDTTDLNDIGHLIEIASCAVGAYFYPDEKAAGEILSNLGISAENNLFVGGFEQYAYEKHICSVFLNDISLTVKIDKQPSDSVK